MVRPTLSRQDIILDFKAAAKRGVLLGNDFVRLASVGDASLCPYLRQLKRQHDWPDDFDGLHFEGPWIVVVCTWFEQGIQGLVQLGSEKPEYIGMCFNVLAARPSGEHLSAMARLIPQRFSLPADPDEFEDVSAWCGAFVRVLSTGRRLEIDAETTKRLRRFGHEFLKQAVRKAKQVDPPMNRQGTSSFPLASEVFYFGPGAQLLKHVGDELSIRLLAELPAGTPAWRKQRDEVVRSIQSRTRHT
jgi:hypothetical protein